MKKAILLLRAALSMGIKSRKSNVVAALLLAVVMLGTQAVPALADTERGSLLDSAQQGIGIVQLRSTHTDSLSVTITTRGAIPGTYYVLLYAYSPAAVLQPYQLGTVQTDSNGNIRFKTEIAGPFSSGEWSFQVFLQVGNYGGFQPYQSEPLLVTFR